MANRDVNGNPATLDADLKGYLKRRTADYIVVVLERAGMVELDCDSPAPRASRPGMTATAAKDTTGRPTGPRSLQEVSRCDRRDPRSSLEPAPRLADGRIDAAHGAVRP